jgi:hypothetical protein
MNLGVISNNGLFNDPKRTKIPERAFGGKYHPRKRGKSIAEKNLRSAKSPLKGGMEKLLLWSTFEK